MDQQIVLPTETLLVSFDMVHGEGKELCIVGQKTGETVTIVNAFEGKKVRDIFKLLTTVQKNTEGSVANNE